MISSQTTVFTTTNTPLYLAMSVDNTATGLCSFRVYGRQTVVPTERPAAHLETVVVGIANLLCVVGSSMSLVSATGSGFSGG